MFQCYIIFDCCKSRVRKVLHLLEMASKINSNYLATPDEKSSNIFTNHMFICYPNAFYLAY